MTAEYNSTTTLREIRAHGPCSICKGDAGGWAKLLRTLGEPHGKPNLDRQVTVLEILESNGLDDALWCLRAASLDRLSRHFQAWCAEQVLPRFLAERPDDGRVTAQIAMLRNDAATDTERAAARAAAWDAAGAAVGAAAWDAAGAAAWAAAGAAARDAAGAAAGAAARDAAGAAQERQLRAMIGEAK
jgi:hypothetical protein